MNLIAWKESGFFLELNLSNVSRKIFVRTTKLNENIPWIVFLHGFPTSSWDFEKILLPIEKEYNTLALDFLGFGLSDKPKKHHYSIIEQADIVEKVLSKLKLDNPFIVSHDYGDTVLQELLSRRDFKGVVLLNGGLYPKLHRPILIQKLLNNKITGPLTTKLVSKSAFIKSLTKTLVVRPSEKELDHLWDFILEGNGLRLYHKLIHYIDDRVQHEQKWIDALEKKGTPKKFIWGLKDPISGEHMIEAVKKKVSNSIVYELNNVGHYPQLEAPEEVSTQILNFIRSIK